MMELIWVFLCVGVGVALFHFKVTKSLKDDLDSLDDGVNEVYRRHENPKTPDIRVQADQRKAS